MPALIFPQQFQPVIGASGQVTFRVNKLSYGDGYEHISPAGLNTQKEKFSVSFPGLSASNKNTLVAFLDSLEGRLEDVFKET